VQFNPELPKLKLEEQRTTPRLSSPFVGSSTPPVQKEFNGLPSPVPAARASTVTPRFGQSVITSPLAWSPTSTLSQGRWNGVGLNIPKPSSHRAATVAPKPTQASTFHEVAPHNCSNTSSPSLERPAKIFSNPSKATLQDRTSIRASSPAPQRLQYDKRPEIPLNSLRQQQHDRSAILKEPTPHNETLFALSQQQRNGSFVNNVLRNERSQTLTPELANVLGSKMGDHDGDMDMDMEDASSSTKAAATSDAPQGKCTQLRLD